MKYILLGMLIGLIFLTCLDVTYQSLKKNHFNKKPEIVFYSKGQPIWKEHGTKEDAERIMKSNPQFELYEMEE